MSLLQLLSDWLEFLGRHIEFRLPDQVPTDFVPRDISSGSEKRATEFYPWVPEDG
jgi:hypothetical protein